MPYGLTLLTPPSEEPVSLAEAKAWLRLEESADDALVSAMASAARGAVERLLGRQLVTATWRLTLDSFPWPGGWQFLEAPALFPDPHTIRLPKAPLQSVSAVEYYDLGDTLRTLDPSVYVVDAATDPGRIFLAQNKVWPVTRLRPGAVRVTFTAGYGGASAVPEEVKTAVKMITAHWYENREAVAAGSMAEVPMAARWLLDSVANGELEYGT